MTLPTILFGQTCIGISLPREMNSTKTLTAERRHDDYSCCSISISSQMGINPMVDYSCCDNYKTEILRINDYHLKQKTLYPPSGNSPRNWTSNRRMGN